MHYSLYGLHVYNVERLFFVMSDVDRDVFAIRSSRIYLNVIIVRPISQ